MALGIDIHLPGTLHIGLTGEDENLELGLSRYRQYQAKKCDERFEFHAGYFSSHIFNSKTEVELLNNLLLFHVLPDNAHMSGPSNVLGGELQLCCTDPMTGFYRNGMCSTGPGDHGLHVVCVRLTTEFLEFSKAMGNDLSTPIPEFDFPGLEEGGKWCLCVTRWKEALEAGHAPQVYIEATHVSALEYVDREDLQAHAVHDEA